jgi:hypothetical protein
MENTGTKSIFAILRKGVKEKNRIITKNESRAAVEVAYIG